MVLIGIELFLIIHLFMGFLASTQVHIDAAMLFLGGEYTAVFWIFVVGLGLILPLFIEIMESNGLHVLNFKQHQQINEFFNVRAKFAGFVTKLRQILRKIRFGKKVSIKLTDYFVNEDIDLKSRLGYLSEYATGMELSKIIDQAG